MKPLEQLSKIETTLSVIRGMLVSTPITYGNVTIDYLHRKNDTKTELSNYMEISFLTTDSRHGVKCREDDIRGMIDVYSTNEIMTTKIAYSIAERLDNAMIDNTIFMTNSEVVGTPYELDKNKYVQRAEFRMVL